MSWGTAYQALQVQSPEEGAQLRSEWRPDGWGSVSKAGGRRRRGPEGALNQILM